MHNTLSKFRAQQDAALTKLDPIPTELPTTADTRGGGYYQPREGPRVKYIGLAVHEPETPSSLPAIADYFKGSKFLESFNSSQPPRRGETQDLANFRSGAGLA